MTPSPESRVKALFDALVDRDPRHWESLIAAAIRDAENQVMLRMQASDLSSEELKMADKHCDWLSFKCAFRAVMKSRSNPKD